MVRVLEGLIWSAGGFVGGFFLAYLLAHSQQIGTLEGIVAGDRSSRSEVVRTAIGVLILLMVALSGARYYQTTSCQTAYNEQVAESLAQRSEAQRREGRAQIDLLTASISGDPAILLEETQKYIDAITELERVRAASPLPESPKCGEF